jgi:hypothetical protein
MLRTQLRRGNPRLLADQTAALRDVPRVTSWISLLVPVHHGVAIAEET